VQQKIPALTEQQAHALITAWVQNGRLSVQTYRDPVNRRDTQGLFVTDPNSPPP
jgi:hypothetical protein